MPSIEVRSVEALVATSRSSLVHRQNAVRAHLNARLFRWVAKVLLHINSE